MSLKMILIFALACIAVVAGDKKEDETEKEFEHLLDVLKEVPNRVKADAESRVIKRLKNALHIGTEKDAKAGGRVCHESAFCHNEDEENTSEIDLVKADKTKDAKAGGRVCHESAFCHNEDEENTSEIDRLKADVVSHVMKELKDIILNTGKTKDAKAGGRVCHESAFCHNEDEENTSEIV